jgi:hypothetical protein
MGIIRVAQASSNIQLYLTVEVTSIYLNNNYSSLPYLWFHFLLSVTYTPLKSENL